MSDRPPLDDSPDDAGAVRFCCAGNVRCASYAHDSAGEVSAVR